MSVLNRFRISTFQVIVLGFVLLILTGSLLLMIPAASCEEGSAPFADCLFTATSAVCVTGLVVRDTATSWTGLGQAIILVLIQIGGMGVVTVAASLAFISGRRIGLMQRSVMQEALSAPQVGGIVRLTRFIVTASLAIELTGALLLLPSFVGAFGWARGSWTAVFHSISAFCNAGFDLMGVRGAYSSLTSVSQEIPVNIVVILLITVGGIGFLVWNDIREHGFHWSRYRLQTRIVLCTSAVLVAVPALWFGLFELRDLPPEQRVLPAVFQSVTLRTAGFNTVDLGAVSDAGQVLMILWMLIGGSPGSTAGGLKTTTVAVLLLTAAAVFRRKDHVESHGRRIGEDVIRNAVAILLMYMLLFMIGGFVISRVEGLPVRACLFETASALGTVGLSLGLTPSLGPVSRAILILLMFWGRVGGLTLIYAAQQPYRVTNSVRPLEKVTVG